MLSNFFLVFGFTAQGEHKTRSKDKCFDTASFISALHFIHLHFIKLVKSHEISHQPKKSIYEFEVHKTVLKARELL